MQLHRIIQLAGFAPDPNWSREQVEPPDTVIATALGGTPIGSQTQGGRIYWVVIPYNGNTANAKPVADATATFDARLVYTINAEHDGAATSKIVIGRKSPGEVEGGLGTPTPIPTGFEIVETVPQQGGRGTIQMLSLAGTAPFFWIFWGYEKAVN